MIHDRTREAHWLRLTDAELQDMHASAFESLHADWPEAVSSFRHVMHIVLIEQLMAMREAVRSGAASPAAAQLAMRSDFAMGYLFGLAAAYVDGCGLPRQGRVAVTALFDVHCTTFGPDDGRRSFDLQDGRDPESIGPGFGDGLLAAHDDTRAFRNWLFGRAAPRRAGLRDGLLRAVAGAPAMLAEAVTLH